MKKVLKLILRTNVAGTTFSDYALVAQDISVGSELKMVRDPKNPHDANAIALTFDDVRVGWIPREKNEMLATMMDHGIQFKCVVSINNVTYTNPAKRLILGVWIIAGME